MAEHVTSKDYSKVRQFSSTLKYTFEYDSTLPGAEILPILEDVRPGWTKEEVTLLVESIRKYGKNWKKIVPLFETKSRFHVCSYARYLKITDKLDEEILTILNIPSDTRNNGLSWTNDERNKLIEGIRMFGKDWRQITDHVGSRNLNCVRL